MAANMPTVRILQRHMVKPAWPAPESSLFLSAVDSLFRENPHNRRILFYKLGDGEEYGAVRERLIASLSVVLAHFYPLAGRLRQIEAEGRQRLEVECNDLGAELVEAVVEGASFQQLHHTNFVDTQPLFMDLVPWIDPRDYAVAPPLCLQISRFACGSFALGIAVSHVVCDGTSLWHFMTSWAECARGENISLPPIHTRTLLKLENPSSKEAFLQVEGGVDDLGKPTINKEKDELKLFHFSKEMVNRLKEKAGGKRSSYEVICAHAWKHTSIARSHADSEKVSFTHIVNMRKRLQPELRNGYFGNAVMWSNCVATAGDLKDEDLATTTNRMNVSLISCNDLAFKGWLHWLEVHGRDEVLTRCMKLNGMRLRASSSPRFPIFQVDFGWGAPIAVRCPCIEIPGKIIFFPSSNGLGSIDLTLALPNTIMQELANDHAFLNP